jgi:hypothetical protein
MKKSRLLSLFLALVMLLGIVSALGGAASAADAPQAWWDGLYIKWELVPGKTVYNIVGYYSVPGVIAQQKAFDDIVFVDENIVYCSSAQNYARIISVEDGIVSFRATNSFANYNYIITDSTQLKLWFTLSAGTGVSDGVLTRYTQQSDEFTSEKVTGKQVSHGYVSPLPSIGTITGSIGISGASNPKAGDVLTATLSGGVANLSSAIVKYQWQRSDDGGNSYSDLWISASQKANKETYTIQEYDAGKIIRVIVTADRYDGVLYSNSVTIPAPLTGTVTISQTNTSNGITLTANLSGAAANIPADKLHYDWRYIVTTDVYGRIRPTGGTYKTLTLPQGDYSTRRYFVYVTADGYEGYLQSGYVKIDAGSPSYPKGDVDRSGQVGNSDLILVARHVVHLVTLTGEQFTLGDMDDDNQITNTDIILVARRIVGL